MAEKRLLSAEILDILGLKGCHTTTLARKPGPVVLAADLRIDGIGFSWWFWVYDYRDGLSPRRKETQELLTAIRWFNQAGKQRG